MELKEKNGNLIFKGDHIFTRSTLTDAYNKDVSFKNLKLVGKNLRGLDLSGADFEKACLEECDFDYCYLEECNFEEADLTKACLEGASLYKANLKGASLLGADLSCCDLTGVNLENADLEGANLEEAKGIFTFNKNEGRVCYAVKHNEHLMIQAGCFWGTINEFEAKAKKKYPNNSLEAYAPQISYLKELQKSLYHG